VDVEKTIEFLLNNQAGHDERLTRLEIVVVSIAGKVESLAGKVDSLAGKVDSLAGSVEKLAGSVDSLVGSVEKLADKVDRLDDAMVSLAESEVRTNQRIDQLVSAIGAMIRPQPPQPSAG
jgi:outer membrane murein-binding lipoprotein Lpp